MLLAALLQPWLNLAGLLLDFLGVILLGREWLVAMAASQREMEIAQREEMFRRRPTMPKPAETIARHMEVVEDMDQRRKFQERVMRANTAWQARRGWFVTAMVLVVFGFLLQILGSIPLNEIQGLIAG